MTEKTKDVVIIKRAGFLMLSRWCLEAWMKGKKYLELGGIATQETSEIRDLTKRMDHLADTLSGIDFRLKQAQARKFDAYVFELDRKAEVVTVEDIKKVRAYLSERGVGRKEDGDE